MREPPVILDEIAAAAASANNQALSDLFGELEPSVLDYDQLPSDFFERLKSLLGNQAFLGLEESWKLVRFIDDNWTLLSSEQRACLKAVLSSVFDKHRNWMGAFVIGEILGKYYSDEDTLNTLMRLAETVPMPTKALVPHGLETLARKTDNARLRALAVDQLQVLAKSKLEELQTEAKQSLSELGLKQ